MNNRTEKRYWTTRDLFLAAYIFARGGAIAGVVAFRTGVVFSFVNSIDLQLVYEDFKSGKPLIDARLYAYAIRNLQEQSNEALMEFHAEG